jgi:hypothetical protein
MLRADALVMCKGVISARREAQLLICARRDTARQLTGFIGGPCA